MSFAFDPTQGPILVEARIVGPLGQADLRLVLDTRATTSLVRASLLAAVGCDPNAAPDRVSVAMGGGIESVPRVTLDRFSALGRHRLAFPVLAHDLPPEARVDGLIGLDFLRGSVLTVDFTAGRIGLT